MKVRTWAEHSVSVIQSRYPYVSTVNQDSKDKCTQTHDAETVPPPFTLDLGLAEQSDFNGLPGYT